ncbi:OsmC family protein [Sporocytophaga myxococcoides]|nr:OsmC family protein [Sporocytophaga myxococcoides]
MLIKLDRRNDAYHFEASNEQGNHVNIDASPAIGGQNLGARPMELLLMGLGGCSAIDVLSILKKQRVEIADFKIEINGEREPEAVPSLFQDIHIKFIVKGPVDTSKVEKAIVLSLDKYCSVAKTLEKTAKITWSLDVV